MAETLNDIIDNENFSRMCECGEFYEYVGSGAYVCPKCGKEYLTDFGKIRRFLEKNGPANVITISKSTGIPRSVVSRFLKEGRLEVHNSQFNDGDIRYCQRCGNMITSGIYCETCAKDIIDAAPKKHGYANYANKNLHNSNGAIRFDRNKK